MTWEKFSRSYQILIYLAILILVIVFFFYFYRQASVTQTNLGQLSVVANQPAVATGNTDIRLNLSVLSSQKFLNLRAATAATPVFTSGKINPFVAQ
jgi:hypothetical protein